MIDPDDLEFVNESTDFCDNISERQRKLPIFKYKEAIIDAVRQHQVLIISGETGCGKTTQIPQYLFEAGLLGQHKMIGITQPRRLATINLATRVAEERNSALGIEVGFEIRFKNMSEAATRIKFMTDGILLNQIMVDSQLTDYGIVIIDEAHERSLRNDVLLGLLRDLVPVRPDLKVIVSSATIDPDRFSKYFRDAPVLSICGREFSVEVKYCASEGLQQLPKEVTRTVIEIANEAEGPGAVLVFLASQEEIETTQTLLRAEKSLQVLPLYGALDQVDQQKVFEPAQSGKRKVILATNIAETSITIEDARFVVDGGYMKQSSFCARRQIFIWEEVRISKAQARQRQGRVGRVTDGVCYRLYTEFQFTYMAEEEEAEMLRVNFGDVYLKLLMYGVREPKKFTFLENPPLEMLEYCCKDLEKLGLVCAETGQLTEDGKEVAVLPVDPAIGKVLLAASRLVCLYEVIVILAMLTQRNIFKRSHANNKVSDFSKLGFSDQDGDHFLLLRVHTCWRSQTPESRRSWCRTKYLDPDLMEDADLVLGQLADLMRQNGHILVPKGHCATGDRSAIKKAFLAGYADCVCRKTGTSKFYYLRDIDKEKLYIHPSSSLFKGSPKCAIYHEARQFKHKIEMLHVMKIEEELLI